MGEQSTRLSGLPKYLQDKLEILQIKRKNNLEKLPSDEELQVLNARTKIL